MQSLSILEGKRHSVNEVQQTPSKPHISVVALKQPSLPRPEPRLDVGQIGGVGERSLELALAGPPEPVIEPVEERQVPRRAAGRRSGAWVGAADRPGQC